MLVWRKFGAVLRGAATPFQIVSAAVLGSMLAFAPGFFRAPGLILVLLLVLVQLNANLVIAAGVGVVAYILSLLLLPVTFHVGIALLEGPVQGFFRDLINGPITAWFGLDYYVTTGGLIMGPLVGAAMGFAIVKMVQGFRGQMAKLEEGSESYKKYMAKRWVRLLAWVVVGGTQNKKPFAEIAGRKIGNPIRPLGAVLVTLVLVLLGLVYAFGSDAVVRSMVITGLEHFNGATVDLEHAELNAGQGQVVLTGLALADAEELSEDLVRARRIEASLSMGDLLRRRATIDLLLVEDAALGEKRAVRGYRIGEEVEPEPEPPVVEPADEGKDLEAYLEDAKVWKERLAKIQEWLEKASRADEKVVVPEGATKREKLVAEAALNGYANVRAEHLITRTPSMLVRELTALGVRTGHDTRTLDIRAENWSTQPSLVEEPPRVSVKASDGAFEVSMVMWALKDELAASEVALAIRGVDAVPFARRLSEDSGKWLTEGTINLAGSGELRPLGASEGMTLDLPLAVRMEQVTLNIPELGPTEADALNLGMHVSGPLSNLRVTVDMQSLQVEMQRVAMEAGRRRLLGEGEKVVGEQKKALIESLGKELESQGGDAKAAEDLVGKLLRGKK